MILTLFPPSSQVNTNENNMDITLQRDTTKDQMLTGAYLTSARIRKGGQYEVGGMI